MSQTPCTWTCTGRLSATKSRMHSCVSLPVGPRQHIIRAVVTSCSAPSLDQASTNSTPAFDLLSFLGLPLWRLRKTPFGNLAVVWSKDLTSTQVSIKAEIQLVKQTVGSKQSSIAIASVWTRELIEASHQQSGSPSASG
jgi:hypothetical protein